MPYRPSQPTRPPRELLVFICQGPSCGERGGAELLAALRAGAADGQVPVRLRTCASSCMDSCATGPNVHLADDAGQLTGTTLESLLRHLRAAEPSAAPQHRPGAGDPSAVARREDGSSPI